MSLSSRVRSAADSASVGAAPSASLVRVNSPPPLKGARAAADAAYVTMRAFLNERLRADQRGFTLVEMVVVMVILTIILAGLSTSMIAGTNSEVAISQRQQAQSNARIALERMRLDIHCA